MTAISKRLTHSGSLLKLIGRGVSTFTSLALLIGLTSQCASNNDMRRQMEVLQSRPLTTQIGSDRKVVITKELTPEENREAFIREVIPNALAWTKNTSADFQERCKAVAKNKKDVNLFRQCESGIDNGVKVPGIGVFTSLIYSYQNIMAPESRVGLLKFIYSQKPVNYDRGESRILSVDGIGKAELVNDSIQEWRTPCVLTWHEYQGNTLVKRKTFDSWIYTRRTLPMLAGAAQTPLNQMLAASLTRGEYWTRILPLKTNR
jgi:hypothetical protein